MTSKERLNVQKLYAQVLKKPLTKIQELKGGYSNLTVLVNSEKIVRIKRPSDRPFYSAPKEAEILRLVSANGLCPALDYFDEATGNLILDYLPHQEGWLSPSISDEDLLKVARMIKTLHALAKTSAVFDNEARFRSYQSHSKVAPFGSEEEKIACKTHALFAHGPSVLSHNDLVEGNVLKDKEGRLALIDFEFAGANHPLFDLASFLSENGIEDEGKARLLLQNVFGEIDEELLKELRLVMAYEDFLWRYWAYERYQETHQDGFLSIAHLKENSLRKRDLASLTD
jgi:thiamine kinase-like enzyme